MEQREDAVAWAAPAPVEGAPPAPPLPPPTAVPTTASAPYPGASPAAPPPPAYAPQPAFATPTFASWQPGFMPLRPLNFGDLLALPFKAMRFNRGVIVGGPLLLTLGATVLMSAAMWLLFTDPSLGLLDPFSQFDSISPTTVVVIVVAVIAALLADVFSSAIVAPGVARGALGEKIRIAEAWKALRPRIGSLLLLYLFAALSLLVAIGIAIAPFFIAAATEEPGLIALGVVLLVLVAFPAGVIITTVGGIARPIVVLEKRGAVAAIRRTTGLLRGRFWWSLLVVFVAAALISFVSGILQQVGSFGAVIVSLFAPDNMVLLGIAFFLITGLSLVVSYVLTYSYLGSLFTLLMIDLRIRHEGFDLTLAQAAEARRA